MAGRQRRVAMIQVLERMKNEWAQTLDAEPATLTALDYAVSYVASGGTLIQLAYDVSQALQWDISRDMLMRYLSEGREAEAKQRFENARSTGAHGLVEQAIKIADEANTSDKEQLTKAKMRADARLWTAERWNRKDMGKAPDVSVVINHNTLHLDALRVRQLQLAEQRNALPASEPTRARLISPDRSVSEVDVIDAVIEPGPLDS
jgi:hypothetical protein